MKKENIAQYHLHKLHPQKLQFEVYDLNEYRNRNIDKPAQPHSHSYYQIIWFFCDEGTHIVDFKTYAIKKNTILFISKDQIHAFDDNLDVTGWLIHFNESFFMHNDVDIFLKYNLFKSQKNPCYIITEEILETASTYLKLMKRELSHRNQFGYQDIIRFTLKSFLITLERIHRTDYSEKLELNSAYELQFFKFKELIEAHYKDGLSVKDYANLLHISSKTLTTISKTVVNKSPSIIIAERIILQAKRLLKFTSLQIGEIAYKIGFDDASYFVKFFKRHVDMSPSSYRG
jgi:AraC-like DNA-binding protein